MRSCSIVAELKDFNCCWSVSHVFCHVLTFVRYIEVFYVNWFQAVHVLNFVSTPRQYYVVCIPLLSI